MKRSTPMPQTIPTAQSETLEAACEISQDIVSFVRKQRFATGAGLARRELEIQRLGGRGE